jgi:hypothetical protein
MMKATIMHERARVGAVVLGLASQVLDCRPPRSTPSEPSAPGEPGETCRSCESETGHATAGAFLNAALCRLNAAPLQGIVSSAETLRITEQLSLIARVGGAKDSPRYRGWHLGIQSITVTRIGGSCEGQSSSRWGRAPACEIERAPLKLTDSECNELFVCLRAAVPAGEGVSWCDVSRLGADGTEYTAELFDSDHRGACVWFEAPECVIRLRTKAAPPLGNGS